MDKNFNTFNDLRLVSVIFMTNVFTMWGQELVLCRHLLATSTGAGLASLSFTSVEHASFAAAGFLLLFFFFFFAAATTNMKLQPQCTTTRTKVIIENTFLTINFYSILQSRTFRFRWRCFVSHVKFWRHSILLRFSNQVGHFGRCWCCNNDVNISATYNIKLPSLTTNSQRVFNCTVCNWSHYLHNILISTACMDDNADVKRILLASPPVDWKRQPGRPHIMWLRTVQ